MDKYRFRRAREFRAYGLAGSQLVSISPSRFEYEVSRKQALCHRQAALRVRGDTVASLVNGTSTVLAHELLDVLFAYGEASQQELTHHALTAVSAFDFGRNSAYHH